MVPSIPRSRVLDTLRAAPPLIAIVAPAGYGKSVLLEQVGGGVVRVPVGATEGHAGLLGDALAQRLKRAFPGALAAVRAAQTLSGTRGAEAPEATVARLIEHLPQGTTLTLAFDEVEQLPRGSEGLEIVQALALAVAEQRLAGLSLILAGRPPMAVPTGAALIGADVLAFDAHEVEELVQATLGEARPALAADVLRDTLGWPALAAARLELGPREPSRDALVTAFGPTIDQVVSGLRGDVRFLAQIAAASGRADRAFLQALASGDVPGSAEARRRLVRLDPSAVERARDELERLSLIVAGERSPRTRGLASETRLHPAAALVLRDRFRHADHAGYLEAHRRAGELVLAQTPEPTAEVVELFSIAEERERVGDLLSKHGPRLELELAATGDDDRLLRWIEGLDQTFAIVPFWADALAGAVGVRSREPARAERGRERLERARTSLSSERREVVLGRWQPRLAEGQALAARAKGAWAEARSWLTRGIDQIAQTKKRGLVPAAEAAEATALELRMLVELHRLSRMSASWDKTREPALAALALIERAAAAGGSDDPRRIELAAALVAGAASAGDKVLLATIAASEASPDSVVARCAESWRVLLDDGLVEDALVIARGAWLAARGNPERALAGAMLGRLAPASEGAHVLAIVAGLGASRREPDPAVVPFALEAELRLGREPSEAIAAEGWLGALQIELAAKDVEATKKVRALEGARDAWRRIGARWDELRMFLELAALADKRLADGDNDARDQLTRALDGAIELAQAAQVAPPWEAMGDARRVESALRAGYRFGSERVRLATKGELERRGADLKSLVTEPRARPVGVSPSAAIGQAKRMAQASGASFIASGRTGSQAMSDAELGALLESKASSLFIVLVPERSIVNFGKKLSLGQKRIMLPLLLELLRHPDEAFTMLELAKRVWDATELTPTIVTKVKVAISRLRALLGRNRAYINTTRKDEGGESVVAYQVAPQLNFLIVEGVKE